ncbi:MAG: chitobiase/beta-hexosaminidase C-terminal domain-containing protein [Bacteroidales bacterium]|nr:chitobiase/beta-hexosaminidase C-terminal domain-containing protein [Bacteroidales bacterium]
MQLGRLQKTIFYIALVMTVMLSSALKAQVTTGTYYIINNNTNAYVQNAATNWYMVPASNGGDSSIDINRWAWNDDPTTPFVTTYQTNKDENSIWLVKQKVVGSTTYHYLIHALSGQYITLNEGIGADGNRRRFHLETNASPNDSSLFTLTSHSGTPKPYSISNKKVTSGHCYLNPTNGNKLTYYASATQYGTIWIGGLIGMYNKNATQDAGSKWFIEPAPVLSAPVVQYNAIIGTYSITWHDSTANHLPLGYQIRYTIDNTAPTTSSPVYNSDTLVVANDGTHVRAIVTCFNFAGDTPMVLTAEVDQVVNTAAPVIPTFEVTCDSKLQINGNTPGVAIYYNYTTDGTEPTDPTNSSTKYTAPVTMADNAKVKAIAYSGSIPFSVTDVYVFKRRAYAPVITMNGTTATITFTEGTVYYTQDGTDPVIGTSASNAISPINLTVSETADIEIRAIDTVDGRPISCPTTVAKRPKKPTFTAVTNCGMGETPDRTHTLTFTNTEVGKTYWYALSNGAGQSAPALNTFTQYTPGSVVSIDTIHFWDGTTVTVTLHVYAKDAENNPSVVVSQDYLLKYTAAPLITHSGTTVTITGDGTVKYIVDGGAEQTYAGPFTVSDGSTHTVTATAQVTGEGLSCVSTHLVRLPVAISSLDEIVTLDGAYDLTCDIADASGHTSIGTSANPFTGSFNGNGHIISKLSQPLFGVTDGAVINDVNLKEVSISQTGDVGAIVCDAKGYTRIYNCGILPTTADFPDGDHSSVESTGPSTSGGTDTSCGGLVGKLEGHSRVVNCFSYADVSSTGYGAGIVGNNTYASTAAVSGGKYTKLRTMVVNCLFYGNVSAAQVWPVYGGQIIDNKNVNGINNYNFYRVGCAFAGDFQGYNCSWPARQEYLTRYEFHRNLLNSNRELCGWWVGAPFAPATMSVAYVQAVPKDASLMAKWVLDLDIAPYPILKPFGKYPSTVNIDADASWRESANTWEGKKLGTLSVTINPGSHAASGVTTTGPTDFVITDMDTVNGDYCYRKIQLPYYNTVFGDPNGANWTAKYAGNYGEYVVTGWDVSATGGNGGTFTQHWQDGYNFADRDCTAKDGYRTFAQGGFYYVPNNVTAITITAHWGKAYYMDNTDHSYDRVYLSKTIAGTHFAPAGYRPSTLNNGQITVHPDKINDVIDLIESAGSVYDYALVLVGNHQYRTSNADIKGTNATKGFTIMSVDFDFDEEPDHCLEWQLGQKYTRQSFCPIRFDFLPVVELGLATKENGSTQYYSLGCYRPLGHFEVTETSLIHFVQFEFGNKSRTIDAPLILNGGIFDQYTKGTESASGANDHINYIIIGGNVLMPSFTPGAHVKKTVNRPTRHCAVNVIGGKFDNLYLTGNYNDNVTPNTDNPHCYVDGGYIKHVAAAGKEGIKGDVTFKINHSVIHEFYGGSTMSNNNQLVTGNITITIDSSMVGKYCGGPKFGDMNIAGNKTIVTNATGTTFREYYGGGNGGTSYVQYDSRDNTLPADGYDWYGTGSDQGALNNYQPGEYIIDTGYKADYDLEIVNVSTGTEAGYAVMRTYFLAAQFSATDTGSITNNLKGCKVLTNFYGGGNLGGVEGTVTSVLDSTEVHGSAFGAGYSASIPEVKILRSNTKTPPTINTSTGIITPQSGGVYDTYFWTNDSNLSTSNPISGSNFFTEVPLINLGTVTGDATIILKGNTTIGTDGVNTTGNVFGGGDQSAVDGNTFVMLQQGATVRGSVYGGGNNGPVNGNSEVIIQDETTNP